MSVRLKPKGKWVYYHVMTRTAQQFYWMKDRAVKKMFIALMKHLGEIFYVEILAHAFLDNHYHIVLKIFCPEFDVADIQRRYELAAGKMADPRPFREEMAEKLYARYTDLSAFMWYLNRGSAGMYNKMMGTKGHLWGARYKNVVVEEDKALLATITYVEMNAVRAGIVALVKAATESTR